MGSACPFTPTRGEKKMRFEHQKSADYLRAMLPTQLRLEAFNTHWSACMSNGSEHSCIWTFVDFLMGESREL